MIKKQTRLAALAAMLAPVLVAQTAPANTNPALADQATEEEAIILSPFEVSAENTNGYAASTTLAGNRISTELRDIGSAVSVITSEFLKDVAATDNRTLLQYTVGSEVGGSYGNFGGHGDGAVLDESSKFANPNTNTRVRGLDAADNTRDFFTSDIPWDGYAVDGVDLQRGANSILFGMGSPAGIINTRSKQASFKDANEVSFRVGSFGSNRQTADFNKVLLKNELSLRLAVLRNDEKFKQKPAFSKDERLYGALRYEPGFMKRNGMRTIVKGNYEAGRVRSNNPRTLPPIDMITPWFRTGTYTGMANGKQVTYKNLNRETFFSAQLTDDNTGRANHGQLRPVINGGPDAGKANPAYNPWIGNFAQQFGGPLVYFNGDGQTSTSSWLAELGNMPGGLAKDGSIDASIGGLPWMRPGGIAQYADFAKNAQLPFWNYGVYKNLSLTDPTVYDFYNQQLDGPNKKEWQDFHSYNASFAQTFFNDQVGFELSYYNEFYKNGRLSLLSGAHQALYIDIMNSYSNGTPTGKNGDPFADGTPNPNVGRPFLSDNGQGNNGSFLSNKNVRRATVFFTQDFERLGKNWFTKFMGKHTLTGLFSADEKKNENRSWIRYTADDAYADWRKVGNPFSITDNLAVPNTVIYLGESLLNRSSASGAYIPNPSAVQVVTPSKVWVFDSTWKHSLNPNSPGYVDPGAEWKNAYYPDIPAFNDLTQKNHPYITTQSENPENYVGWTQKPITWIDSEASEQNRLHNTTSASRKRVRVSSTACVWQGKFLDNAIVGTWGVRKDVAKQWVKSYTSSQAYNNPATRGVIDWSTNPLKLDENPNGVFQSTSHSWMVVTHLNDLPWIKDITKGVPINVSLFYNKSQNFQPSEQRYDVYGEPLAPPMGITYDKGILLETKDGRFSAKLTKFTTSSKNNSNYTLSGNFWFIGASQVWSGNWANRFQYDWKGGNRIFNAVAEPDPTDTEYNYGPAEGETLADAQAREAAAVSAWRAWQKALDPRFYSAWKFDLNKPFVGQGTDLNTTQPDALAATEDRVSKGYELELNAAITKNWRLTINGAKVSAIRTNIGGAALTDFVTKYEKALNTTAAGDLRIWWGGPGNETAKYQWNSRFGSEYHMFKLTEGTDVPELRKWRFNAISNYDFDRGVLKGFNVGGGVRYESGNILGYPVIDNPEGDTANYDISKPYHGAAEYNFDVWVGYARKVTKRIDWSIQLNVRNLFVGNELVPITVQPDGSPAAYRIRPGQTWQLTNTFRF